MLPVLSIDFETRSTVDLVKCGVYVYAEDPSTDVLCMAWAFGDEEPELWLPPHFVAGQGIVTDVTTTHDDGRIYQHIRAGGEIRAHNAQFERLIWREVMVKKYGAPPVRDEQFVCTAAEAAAMALPRSLDGASKALGIVQKKDDVGYKLMLQMSKPRSFVNGTPIWWEDAAKKERLYEYCRQDVRVERAIAKAVRRLSPHEREIYLLDQRINDRGVAIDRALVAASASIVDIGLRRANARIDELTNGDVSKVTQNGRLVSWLQSEHVDTDSVSKAAVAALKERDDLSDTVVNVLDLRAEAGRASVAKLKAFERATCKDGRARGLLLYHGASTGRWTGKLIQPQNLPRGEIADADACIPDILAGNYETIAEMAPPILVVLSLLRGMLIAPYGHDLIAGDFSAIEARVLNWLAGQNDIVALFAAGEDVYKHNAARLYNIPIEQVEKFPHRQTGKFQELGCGFGMGAEKAVTAAKDVYGLTLTEETAKTIVGQYRATHPRVKDFWTETHEACMDAVRTPGVAVTFGALRNLKAIAIGGYLYIKLPSERYLCYARPSVEMRTVPWSTPEKPEQRPSLHFYSVEPLTKRWTKQFAYGGLLVENIVQAVARDLMADAMLRLEAAGYLPVLSVHDEVICEIENHKGSLDEFLRIMQAVPEWAAGCPIAAEGWRDGRYHK